MTQETLKNGIFISDSIRAINDEIQYIKNKLMQSEGSNKYTGFQINEGGRHSIALLNSIAVDAMQKQLKVKEEELEVFQKQFDEL
jgi:hypothetical protein